jgi:hypothetical protein
VAAAAQVAVPGAPARAAVTAATGAKWSVQRTPNARVANGTFAADSCAGPAWCVAVGSAKDSSGTSALAEAWNGTSWRVMAVPVPPGGTHSAMDGVSCTTATACTAVGRYTSNQNIRLTLAERWNGVAWSVQRTPNPAAPPSASPDPTAPPHATLDGVSCASATSCTAVGYYLVAHGSALLVEHWNGTAWAIQQARDPRGAYDSALFGVSCAAATACVAVGDYLSLKTDDILALAEVWNGSAWTVEATPKPAGSIVSRLYAVSCTAQAACTAVGGWIQHSGSPLEVTLAETWNGTAWAIQPTPSPAGTTGLDELDSVSCRSAASCTAAGHAGGRTLAEAWNGTAWAIQPTPNHGPGSFTGVACDPAACTAVGHYRSGTGATLTLAVSSNGTSWAVQATPSPAGAVPSVLDGVSCGSATACTAVGFYAGGHGSRTLAEAWNGSAWAIQPTPDLAGFAKNSLASVSCGTASACMAVGMSAGRQARTVLAESWNGSTWNLQPAPAPPGEVSELSGVSCPSATDCMAVGYYSSASAVMPLADLWNGTTWTIELPPGPTGGFDPTLTSVSCTSPSACTAVGYYDTTSGGSQALAERWDGTSWTVQATPAVDSTMYGVSCGSATECTAVGNTFSYPAGVATLAEAWRHGTWQVQRTPFLPGPFFHGFNGVSCRSARSCAATGNYDTGLGVSATLAEVWNGRAWVIQHTPPPPSRGGNSTLAAVSRQSATSFAAVGSRLSSAGVSVTLAETRPG